MRHRTRPSFRSSDLCSVNSVGRFLGGGGFGGGGFGGVFIGVRAGWGAYCRPWAAAGLCLLFRGRRAAAVFSERVLKFKMARFRVLNCSLWPGDSDQYPLFRVLELNFKTRSQGDPAGLRVVAGFAEDGADRPQQRGFVGEQRGHAGAAFDLLVGPLEHVGRPQAAPVLRRTFEDRQYVGYVGFCLSQKVGRTGFVCLREL